MAIENGVAWTETTLTVHGDPMTDLTEADYAERETFMVEAVALLVEAQGIMDVDSRDRRTEVRGAVRAISRLIGSMNGSGVRGGTLHPPTRTQREALARAAALIRGR